MFRLPCQHRLKNVIRSVDGSAENFGHHANIHGLFVDSVLCIHYRRGYPWSSRRKREHSTKGTCRNELCRHSCLIGLVSIFKVGHTGNHRLRCGKPGDMQLPRLFITVSNRGTAIQLLAGVVLPSDDNVRLVERSSRTHGTMGAYVHHLFFGGNFDFTFASWSV